MGNGITLRPYQIPFYDSLRKALAVHPRVIACMATGGGKTKTFVKIALDSAAKGRSVLILSEALSILTQIKAEVPAALDLGYMPSGGIMVGMSQTLVRRPAILSRLQELGPRLLIIADEAHIGTHSKALKQLPDAYLLGFTATPDYRKAKHLPEIYEGCVVGPQPAELVELGALSRYRHYERRGAGLDALQKKNGEYTEESQHIAFDSPEALSALVSDVSGTVHNKVMIFTSSIKSAGIVSDYFRSAGVEVSEVHTGRSDAEFQLFLYRKNAVRVCVSVGSLTKGFDDPATDLIVLWRATTSLPLYLQMIGRGSRVIPGVKEEFTVLDYGQNGSRHGRWDHAHDWGEMWHGKDRGKGVAPSRLCPVCFALMPVQVVVCSECGYKWAIKPPKRVAIDETRLVELAEVGEGRRIGSLTPAELAQYARGSGGEERKRKMAARVARSKGEAYLSEYAAEMGYKSGWVQHQKGMGVGFTDIIVLINN